MSQKVIEVENISKLYRLGLVGTGSLVHDVNRWWHTMRGREDPYQKIGKENNRALKVDTDYVWSLKDINFEVNDGDAVGIIGRNGAGKSTLLKILSRITSPTTGSIHVKGRVASLLEVGTGFHPELTGRENVYLNGAIMGMTQAETRRKIAEIVEFAGVEAYIDTPVKRYSTGMTVRLGFSIAAHLEPEILIVDEVLAVGDAEFQKKCMGKMNQVSKDGRTVLFVSHNMGSISELCARGILLDNGKIARIGTTQEVIDLYFDKNGNMSAVSLIDKNGRSGKAMCLSGAKLKNAEDEVINTFRHDEQVLVYFDVIAQDYQHNAEMGFTLKDARGRVVFSSNYALNQHRGNPQFTLSVSIPKKFLTPGIYHVDIAIHVPNVAYLDKHDELLSFTIYDSGSEYTKYGQADIGVVYPPVVWQYQ